MDKQTLNKTLAMAIGWDRLVIYEMGKNIYIDVAGKLKKFDYMDWAVIGPIATKYKCFPKYDLGEWKVEFITKLTDMHGFVRFSEITFGKTPQVAIALAALRITLYPDN